MPETFASAVWGKCWMKSGEMRAPENTPWSQVRTKRRHIVRPDSNVPGRSQSEPSTLWYPGQSSVITASTKIERHTRVDDGQAYQQRYTLELGHGELHDDYCEVTTIMLRARSGIKGQGPWVMVVSLMPLRLSQGRGLGSSYYCPRHCDTFPCSKSAQSMNAANSVVTPNRAYRNRRPTAEDIRPAHEQRPRLISLGVATMLTPLLHHP